MSKRTKLRNARCKAVFGIGEAAIAASILTSSAANTLAQSSAAKQQANAINASSKMQADAIKSQNENNNELQQQSIDFIKSQNEEARQIQQDIQMTLQEMAAGESMKNRNEESKLVVRNGGSSKQSPFLRGRNKLGNMPFVTTDGGGVQWLGETPEGFDLYMTMGNDHEHYHKTRGGKYKSGVGFKFANGGVVEGEGNQKGRIGELLLNTPDGGYFLSKHTIGGFNPTKAVLRGMNPVTAYNIQERNKAILGIDNDTPPVGNSKKAMFGTFVNPTFTNYGVSPNLYYDTTAPIVAIANTKYKAVPKLKYGGRVKAWSGVKVTNKDMTGAYVGAGANLIGSIISSIGANRAGHTLASAYNRAGDLLAGAYGSLSGIDMSALDKSAFRSAHALPAIISPHINIRPQLAGITAQGDMLKRQVNRTSLSSAARNARLRDIDAATTAKTNEIYARQSNETNQRMAENARIITEAANQNANRDIEANKNYGQQYLQLLQYNNDIANQRIMGAAQARADALTQAGSALATSRQAVGSTLGSGLAQAGSIIGEGYSNALKTNTEAYGVWAGADLDTQIDLAVAWKNPQLLQLLKNRLTIGGVNSANDKQLLRINKALKNIGAYHGDSVNN